MEDQNTQRERERERENIIEVHHRLEIESVSDVPEGKTRRLKERRVEKRF